MHGYRVEFNFSCLFSGNRGEFNSSNTSSGVKGRLSAAVSFWKLTLNPPEFVIDIITRGYRLPFAGYPPPCFLANNASAFPRPDYVSQAICELLEKDCIVERNVPPFFVNPLSVAKGKTLGLVIDLRHVNNFLMRFQFKYEDLCPLSQVLEEGNCFFFIFFYLHGTSGEIFFFCNFAF